MGKQIQRSELARKVLKSYKKDIDNYIQAGLTKMADNVVKDAIYNRQHAYGHNYTGNLISSIVGAVYHNGSLVHAKASYEIANREPIRREMTEGGGRHGVYTFKQDYDYYQDMSYVPEISTDQSTAIAHIEDFIISYQSQAYFEIVIAYTACYAEFVERERHSLGLERTMFTFSKALLGFTQPGANGWSGVKFKVTKV